MTSITRLDIDKLSKVCALFSSNQMGERATAAFKADEMVRAAGLTWLEILNPTQPAYRHADPPPRREEPLSAGEILAHYDNRLTDWEKRFLGSIVRQRGRMSVKQRPIFEEIQNRFAGCGR